MISDEQLDEIAAMAVAAAVAELADDEPALLEILDDHNIDIDAESMSDEDQEVLRDRLANAIRRCAPSVPFNPGTGVQPGYVVGLCGHRVAESEWKAGLLRCERC